MRDTPIGETHLEDLGADDQSVGSQVVLGALLLQLQQAPRGTPHHEPGRRGWVGGLGVVEGMWGEEPVLFICAEGHIKRRVVGYEMRFEA